MLKNNQAEVVIWENGTGSAAIETLHNKIESHGWSGWVELLVSAENLGFTGGNNRVMERALKNGSSHDYFLLLNSDTLVTNQSFTALVEHMDSHPRVGIAGSKLLDESGGVQSSPFRFPSVMSEFDAAFRLGLVSRCLSSWNVVMEMPEKPCQVDWVSGASMILRREMVEQIGVLDEGFFTYYEDVDLCQRAYQENWTVEFVPDSQVVHLEGASSGISHNKIKRRPAYWFQARRRFYLKHYGAMGTVLIDAAFIVGFSLWRLRRFLQNKPDTDPPNMLFDFIRHSVFLNGFKQPVVKI
jgi:GT2 family glycosyltransferase